MSYLLDKKTQRKKIFNSLFICVFLFILFFFRLAIFSGFSYVIHTIFRPVLALGSVVGEKFKSLDSFLISKNSLYLQNQDLQNKLAENNAQNSNYNSLLSENVSLKEILGRNVQGRASHKMILATILSKTNQSLYDVLVIDVGEKDGIKVGNLVFVLGNVPIGRVSFVYDNSSKVTLFSNPGEKMQVVLSSRNTFLEIIGRGGGNFEMIMPTDFTPQKGDEVVLPGINTYVVGVVESIISDPRDSFIKIILSSPVNIQEQKFVQIEK
ncbi:MAG: rod shape-determining protein MreC [Candidatus Parcubacteria bacterium]|nr:rod shape-determining protein MreC [Candidatus Parcubacteria bacterium]